MKQIFLSALIAIGVTAQAQQISEINGQEYMNITLQAFSSTYDEYSGFVDYGTYGSGDGQAGIKLSSENAEKGKKYYYTVISKTGIAIAKHEVNENFFLRFNAMLAIGKASVSSEYIDNKTVYKTACPIKVELKKSNYSITYIFPTCEDL